MNLRADFPEYSIQVARIGCIAIVGPHLGDDVPAHRRGIVAQDGIAVARHSRSEAFTEDTFGLHSVDGRSE